MKTSTEIKEGYLVISVKLRETSTASHQLFIKQHQTRDSDSSKPTDRTLLVLNVPPYVSKSSLERVFHPCGAVQSVYLHQKPTAKAEPEPPDDSFSPTHCLRGYRVAYVVFKSPIGLEAALNPEFQCGKKFYTKKDKPATGLNKWCAEYGSECVNPDKLQEEINKHMEQYDGKQQQEKVEEKALDGVPDDEGWVTVTRHSKHKGMTRTESHERRALAKEKRKRKNTELLNFYAFQQRQTKRDHIANLRKKFEEDKTKVDEMRAARKFKPY